MPIGREVKLLISSIILIALAVVLAIQYTGVCRLEAVTLNGQPVEQWDQKLGLFPDRTVIRQPIDSLATALLEQQGITRVDIQYRLPNMLKISTNSLDPICYMIDRLTGTFFGLDESGRVVPIDIAHANWEMPIFTGLRVRRMHDYTDDYRANLVIPQLQELRRTDPSLYQSIEDVDFSHPNYVGLGFSGRSFRLNVPADRLLQRFDEFNIFVSRYNPPMDSTSCFDMTYDDEIIRVGAVPHKELPPIDTASINDKADFSDEADLTPAGTVEIPVKPVVSEETSPTSKEDTHEGSATTPVSETPKSIKNPSPHKTPAAESVVHKQPHTEKAVTPSGTLAAQSSAPAGKSAATPVVSHKSVLAKSKSTTSIDTKAAKVTATQVSGPTSQAHAVAARTTKSAGQSKAKGAVTKKGLFKKPKSKASLHH